VRIVAGRFKGRRLRGPGQAPIRPTSDRLRETLFNVLGGRLDGPRVLDMFAGTGALGLEALSRGASHVTFVDQSPEALGIIRHNVDACAAGGVVAIHRADAARLGSDRRWQGRAAFDLILLDPPYDQADLAAAVETAGGLLAPDGLLVLEHDRRRQSPEVAGRLTRHRIVESGDSALSFYR
jgi:16S rRNA (guanine966-N2)-methyltransferase